MADSFKDLTIFMSDEGAFISKPLKNGKPSKNKRVLTEQEIMSFVTWFIRRQCKSLNAAEFTLNVDGAPRYKMGFVEDSE